MADELDPIKVRKLVTDAHEILTEHEKTEHLGARCSDERSNLIGFLIHCLGMSRGEVLEAVSRAVFYLKEHEVRTARNPLDSRE